MYLESNGLQKSHYKEAYTQIVCDVFVTQKSVIRYLVRHQKLYMNDFL